MSRRYNSFLIRWWRLSSAQRRIEVEHIQSGRRSRVASLEAARDWIQRQEAAQDTAPEDEAPEVETPKQVARDT
ncbi:MAG: hypothetical protein ACRDI2_02275 [Chloroflexota bacterium]